MDSAKLAKFKAELIELRNRLRDEIQDRVDSIPDKLKGAGDISDVPTHFADRGSESLDADIAAGDAQSSELQAVKSALERIDQGTFGTCLKCKSAIGQERLEAVPYATYCIDCARDQESGA